MAQNRGCWVQELRLDAGKRVEPVCSPEFLDAARDEVGQDALDWAVELGYDTAIRAIAKYPEFGQRIVQVDTLRLGTESAATIAMLGIFRGSSDTPDITDDAIRAIQEWVHRGISLPSIWAAMRQGHARLTDGYMRACMEVVPADAQPDQLQLISEVLFNFVDRFSAAVGREYGQEHERWVMSTVAAREEVVRSILDGNCADTASAENVLSYILANRHHLGLIVWADSLDAAANSSLHKFAIGLLHAAGAEQTLLLPHGGHSVHAWGNSSRPLRINAVPFREHRRPGLRAVLGTIRSGRDGFAQTHLEARSARSVTETLPGLDEPVIDFPSIHLLTLLGQDRTRAEDFVHSELGPLAGDEHQLTELRKTAAAYLRLRRSPLAVAHELYIVRNTVNYRLKKVEEMIGHSLDERTVEVWAALLLRDGLGPAADMTPYSPPTVER